MGPLAVIMAPVRELAQQIEEEALKLGKHTGIRTCCVVGGVDIHEQAFKLREGVDVVIATPGRLVDCLDHHYVVLNQCNYVVLDEADKMIDMGFEPQVVKVLDAMSGTWKSTDEAEALKQEELMRTGKAEFRTTIMFSATMPAAVERLAKTYLRFPAIVSIGDRDSGKNKRIKQELHMMPEAKKKGELLKLLAVCEKPCIVFGGARKSCDVLARHVSSAGFPNVVLHGGKAQDQREQALETFKQGGVEILIATDVAGRGLDIPGVMHIINYDMPSDIDRYCHRIGRTGRAGKEGKATSFVTEDDEQIFVDLEKYLASTDQPVPHWLHKGAIEAQKPKRKVREVR